MPRLELTAPTGLQLHFHDCRTFFWGIAVLISGYAAPAHAALIDPNFSGNVSDDQWTLPALSAESNPGYPGGGTNTNLWPSPIGSDLGGDAQLDKTSGGGYPLAAGSGGGIYTFDADGNFQVLDATPVASIQTVLLQFEISSPAIAPPVLNYNGGTQAIAPVTTAALSATEQLFQWDLTGIGGAITHFDLNWGMGIHSQIAAIRLDQSSVMTQVPEPLGLTLFASGSLALVLNWRRFAAARIVRLRSITAIRGTMKC
ncbi:MAG: hypothetical protein IT427_11915 [Pirellulales bacterium]|nr:hypothetical protein [Pirellulales bacterium]